MILLNTLRYYWVTNNRIGIIYNMTLKDETWRMKKGLELAANLEQLHFHFSLSCIGEGNGNPLQCSCLENPRDGGAWWATVYGVAQSWTRLKRLSSSSSSRSEGPAPAGVWEGRAHFWKSVWWWPCRIRLGMFLPLQFFWKSFRRMDVTATPKSLQSCPTLCDPIDSSPPGSPVPGILQARTLEWVAISFSNAWRWKVKVKSLSRVWPSATPWTAAFQAPPSMGFSRQEYWSGVPLPFSSKE